MPASTQPHFEQMNFLVLPTAANGHAWQVAMRAFAVAVSAIRVDDMRHRPISNC